MSELSWIWLLLLGFVGAALVICSWRRISKPRSIVPIVQQRRDLQEELAALVPPEIAATMLRTECARSGRPSWDPEALAACVRHARASKSGHDEPKNEPQIAAKKNGWLQAG